MLNYEAITEMLIALAAFFCGVTVGYYVDRR